MKSQRLSYIDLAKGWAILLVIAGHIVQYCMKGEPAKAVFDFIYSFHMPLFFYLSGYVAYLGRSSYSSNATLSFIKKKALSLILPFIVWGG